MWGARDTWVPPVLLDRWRKDLPRARFVVFDASHVPMEEIPERSVAEALDFLEATGAHGT
jgi:pimeloyl-ACP methyl ester carboxylesterase